MTTLQETLLACASDMENWRTSQRSWGDLTEEASNPIWNRSRGWEPHIPQAMQKRWGELPEEMQVALYLAADSVRDALSWREDID